MRADIDTDICLYTVHSDRHSHHTILISVTRSGEKLVTDFYDIHTVGSRTVEKFWNSLPAHIRSIDTLSTFKRHLKFHLFQSAFTV